MSYKMLERAVIYTKELQEMGLFGVMSNTRWFVAFGGTVFYFIMLPLLATLLIFTTLFNLYELITTNNKNFDKWFSFICSLLGTTCASISLYGATFATALSFSFTAGPWFFLGSVLVAFIHQSTMLALNSYRAYESLGASGQRMHYIQALCANAFNLILLTAVLGAVIFAMLTPLAPALGSACAVATIVLIACNTLWRLVPYDWKLLIKKHLNLGKPEDEEDNTPQNDPLNQVIERDPISSPRLFTQFDYSASIRSMNNQDAFYYLQRIIERKIAVLDTFEKQVHDKNNQKLRALIYVLDALEQGNRITKNQLVEDYPLVNQSFWVEKGEVEQIIDAVISFQNRDFDEPLNEYLMTM